MGKSDLKCLKCCKIVRIEVHRGRKRWYQGEESIKSVRHKLLKQIEPWMDRGRGAGQRGPLGSEGQRSSKDTRSSTPSATTAKKELTRDGDDEQLVENLQRLAWNSSVLPPPPPAAQCLQQHYTGLGSFEGLLERQEIWGGVVG